jgi:CBS domain containing-hemolysin-like protein
LIVGLLVLLGLDLFTTAFRAAFLNASLARLLSLKEEMETKVSRAVSMLQAPQEWQAASNLTQLFTRFLGASLLLALFAPREWMVSTILVELGILLLAVVIVFWLEWIVEVVVTGHPEAWAMRLAPYVRSLMVILSPLLILPLAIGRRRGEAQGPMSTVTEEELKSMVDAGHEGGVLEGDERQMIYSIFELGDTLVREIMLPRIYINALEVSTPLPQAVDTLIRLGHSRVPVYEESVDNILGLLYAKDLLRVWNQELAGDQAAEGNQAPAGNQELGSQGDRVASLRNLLRPATFVPEAEKVDELLAEMQEGHVHMAMVVDEYGGIAGLVTLEDIFEEIVGEIQDEYDQSEEAPYMQVGEGEYIFQGRVDLKDFNEVMGSQLPTEETETLGGFIYEQVGRVPVSGESLRVGDINLTIEQVTRRRIRKVRALKQLLAAQEGNQDGNDADK